MISRVALDSYSVLRLYVSRYLENWVSCVFYNYDAGIAETLRRLNVATLSRSLILTYVDQTSRRCNVMTLECRDVAAWVFTSSSSHF